MNKGITWFFFHGQTRKMSLQIWIWGLWIEHSLHTLRCPGRGFLKRLQKCDVNKKGREGGILCSNEIGNSEFKTKWKKKFLLIAGLFRACIIWRALRFSWQVDLLAVLPLSGKHFSKTTVLWATLQKMLILSLDLNLKENETILCIQQSSTNIYECLPCVPGHRWCTAQSQGATFT